MLVNMCVFLHVCAFAHAPAFPTLPSNSILNSEDPMVATSKKPSLTPPHPQPCSRACPQLSFCSSAFFCTWFQGDGFVGLGRPHTPSDCRAGTVYRSEQPKQLLGTCFLNTAELSWAELLIIYEVEISPPAKLQKATAPPALCSMTISGHSGTFISFP